MKRCLVVTLVPLLVLGFALIASAHHGQETVVFPTKMGEVTFQHYAHQKRVSECTTCHHMGAEPVKCTNCHGVDESAPKPRDAFHKLCKGCHQEKGGDAPTNCKGCHVK